MLSMLNSHMYVLKYDDFSLPQSHQKPNFSPLSCCLQAPERNSWKVFFRTFFTQMVVFAFCDPYNVYSGVFGLNYFENVFEDFTVSGSNTFSQ